MFFPAECYIEDLAILHDYMAAPAFLYLFYVPDADYVTIVNTAEHFSGYQLFKVLQRRMVERKTLPFWYGCAYNYCCL